MKTKKFNQKLTLNKRTVSNLNSGQMRGIKGGHNTNITCEYCDTVESCEHTFCLICESIPDTVCAFCLETEPACNTDEITGC